MGPGAPPVWDTKTAQRAIDFFAKVLKLNGGEHEGKPFNLLPWQCFIVGSVFGWQNSDGYRRFRMVYVESGIDAGMTQAMVIQGFKIHERQRQMKKDISELTKVSDILNYPVGWTDNNGN